MTGWMLLFSWCCCWPVLPLYCRLLLSYSVMTFRNGALVYYHHVFSTVITPQCSRSGWCNFCTFCLCVEDKTWIGEKWREQDGRKTKKDLGNWKMKWPTTSPSRIPEVLTDSLAAAGMVARQMVLFSVLHARLPRHCSVSLCRISGWLSCCTSARSCPTAPSHVVPLSLCLWKLICFHRHTQLIGLTLIFQLNVEQDIHIQGRC